MKEKRGAVTKAAGGLPVKTDRTLPLPWMNSPLRISGRRESLSVDKYDAQGKELEYKWVETGVFQGSSDNLMSPEGDLYPQSGRKERSI